MSYIRYIILLKCAAQFRVSRYREVVDAQDAICRVGLDPRFEDLSGDFNEHTFHEGYGFLDEMRVPYGLSIVYRKI